jgi:serine protease Do
MFKITMRSITFLLISLCFTLWAIPSQAEMPPAEESKPLASLSGVLKNVMPAIVNIYVQGQLPPGHYPVMTPQGPSISPQQVTPKFQDIGSGVVVNAQKGLIITNAHVVRNAQTIIVTMSDSRRFKARLIGVDDASDIAVLQIHTDHLEAITFADSAKVKVGDFVLAIGSPFGLLTQSVTSGIVSALNRSDLGIEGYENFIQTDAPINPGNSGGALVNMEGQLIGINTAIIAPSGGSVGIGFAIPSDMAKSVMDQLIQFGNVKRGLLGVMVQNLTPDLADALNAKGIKGALITEVAPGSPAAKAGLQTQDIIKDINGQAVENAAQMRNAVGLTRVGNLLKITILRGSRTEIFTATPVPKEQAFAPVVNSLLAGVRLRDYDEINLNTEEIKGVQVIALDDNSAGALNGLSPQDVIISADGKPVTNVSELLKIAEANTKSLLLQVKRGGTGTVFLVINNN